MSDDAFFDGAVVLAEEVVGGNLDAAYEEAGGRTGTLFFLCEAVAEIMDPPKEPFDFPGFRRMLTKAADPADARNSLLAAAAEFAADWRIDDEERGCEVVERAHWALAAARSRPARLCGVVAASMAQAVSLVYDNVATGLDFVESLEPLIDLAAEVVRAAPAGTFTSVERDPRFPTLAAPIDAGGLASWLWNELKEFNESEVQAELDVEFSRAAAWRVGNGLPLEGPDRAASGPPRPPEPGRDEWMYNQYKAGKPLKAIRYELCRLAGPRGWRSVGTPNAVYNAIKRWCSSNGAAMPSRRNSSSDEIS